MRGVPLFIGVGMVAGILALSGYDSCLHGQPAKRVKANPHRIPRELVQLLTRDLFSQEMIGLKE
jgi:hypothetical protein